MTGYVRAFNTTDLPNGSSRLWRHHDKRIAVWRVRDRFFAADNRCPHEGYALTQGDVSGDVLTCAWHNWKFRLTDGRCLFGGEDVRTYPVRVQDGQVLVDVTDPEPEEIAPQLFGSLLEAMGDVNTGRLARDTMRLRSIGTPLTEVIKVGVDYGASRAEYGWNHSLATLADCLTMAAAFEGPLSALPVVQGLSVVSQTEVRRPPRPQADPVDVVAEYGSVADALAAFPGLVDAERPDDAEGLMRGALRAGASPGAVRHAFLTAITNHFLGYGHPMIYCQKAFDLLDRIGWSEAETVLAPLVPAITWSTRYDRLPYMKRFLAAWRAASPGGAPAPATAPVAAAAPAAAAAAAPAPSRNMPNAHLGQLEVAQVRTWHAGGRDDLRRTLLDGMPEDAVAGVLGALDSGVAVGDVIDAIAGVAAARLGRFDMDTDTDDSRDAGWLDVTHTLTYTNALRWAWRADPSPEVLRGVLHAAWFTQWTGKFDAKGDPAPVPARPGSDAGEVLDAVRRKDPERAVALVKGYDGPAAPLESALRQAAAEDNAAAPIMVAHTVKTTMAAVSESRLSRDRAPLAATARFLAAPKRESFVYRSTLDAIDFIAGRAKGDAERQ
ncbi:MAG: Rieske (2Fe-2S) protein [Nocardiopsaceae bacterium]|nr:Rieske (2Fe-2S) protein [Nocardiopsaceae bacterium]